MPGRNVLADHLALLYKQRQKHSIIILAKAVTKDWVEHITYLEPSMFRSDCPIFGGRSVKHMQFNMNNWTKLLNKNSIEQVSFPQHIYSPSYLLNLTVLNTYNWNNIVLNHFTIELLANWKFNNWTSPIEQLHDLSEQWVFWTISNSFINNWTTIYWTKVICLIALVQ